MTIKNYSKTLLAAVALSASINAFASDVVFEYSPTADDVTSNVDFNRVATMSPTSPAHKTAPYSEDKPLLRNTDGNYSGPNIYGGYQFSSSNTSWIFNREEIRDGGSKPDTITLQCYSQDGWGGAEMSLQALFLFKQADFEDGFKKKPVTIDGLSTRWSTYFKGTNRNVDGRFVVQIKGALYVSDFSFNMTNSASIQLAQQNLKTVKWAEYKPESDLNFNADDASFKLMPLNNVTAVGIYVEDDQWIGDESTSSPYVLSISSFKATGAAQ